MNSERLTYRPWDPQGDVDAALRIYGDEQVTRYIGGHTPADRQAAATMLANWHRLTSRYPAGFNVWAALLDGEVIGAALLKPLPTADRKLTEHIEVGWHLGRAHWGQGFATEMGRRMLRLGFEELDLKVINCVVEPANAASVRVAERLGLEAVGRTSEWYGLELLHFVGRSDG